MYACNILSTSGRWLGPVWLAGVEDVLQSVELIGYRAPGLRVTDEAGDSVLNLRAGSLHAAPLTLGLSPRARRAAETMHPLPEFASAEDTLAWLRRESAQLKTDAVSLADRLRKRAPRALLSAGNPVARRELMLLAMAACHGVDPVMFGYKPAHQVVEEVLLFNDEDF